jgi:hypothetical protein
VTIGWQGGHTSRDCPDPDERIESHAVRIWIWSATGVMPMGIPETPFWETITYAGEVAIAVHTGLATHCGMIS